MYSAVLNHQALPCIILSRPVLYCPILLFLSYLVLSSWVLSWCVLCCPKLPSTVLSCPVLNCPELYCPAMSCNILYCSVFLLSFFVSCTIVYDNGWICCNVLCSIRLYDLCWINALPSGTLHGVSVHILHLSCTSVVWGEMVWGPQSVQKTSGWFCVSPPCLTQILLSSWLLPRPRCHRTQLSMKLPRCPHLFFLIMHYQIQHICQSLR